MIRSIPIKIPALHPGQFFKFAPFHGKYITILQYKQIILYPKFNIFGPSPQIRGDRDGGQGNVHSQRKVLEIGSGPVVASGGDVGAQGEGADHLALTECEKYEYKNAIKQVFEVLEVLQIREKGRKDD